MSLAGMMAEDRDALICDLAEVYQIYDYHDVPVKTLGILCSGLGPDSRIGMKAARRYAPRSIVMLAMICDELNDIRWGLLTDGTNEEERPEHVTPYLYEHEGPDEKKVVSYKSGEDFEKARAELIKRLE